jgi:GNAT superfamily N-acetyltransferase
MITVKRTTSEDKDFNALISELNIELRRTYGNMQDEYDQYNIIENLETVVIIYSDNAPIGCGCFKKFDDTSVEIKRMFVAENQRGKGMGALIIKELESWAAEQGFKKTVLETGYAQPEAIRLYKKMGYVVIPNYGPYIGNEEFSICMKKFTLVE